MKHHAVEFVTKYLPEWRETPGSQGLCAVINYTPAPGDETNGQLRNAIRIWPSDTAGDVAAKLRLLADWLQRTQDAKLAP